jgi:predicted GH43/DUF377 family glycosyl hydrolase
MTARGVARMTFEIMLVLLIVLPVSVAFAIIIPGIWTKYIGNPVFGPGAGGSWDDRSVYGSSILYDGLAYHMWYTGMDNVAFTNRLGYATSSDGINWSRSDSNPVITGTLGGWDASGVSRAVVISDTGQFKMWYTGQDTGGVTRIGYAASADGIHWDKAGNNPVIDQGTSGWEGWGVEQPAVIKVAGIYKMWYRGSGWDGCGFGYATSLDGVTWAKYAGNPVILGESNGFFCSPYAPNLLFDGVLYHLWYSKCDVSEKCQVYYAISGDGINWTQQGIAIQPGSTGAFDSIATDYPTVLLVGDSLKMWFSGSDGARSRIGYATAPVAILDKSIFLPLIMK